MTLSLTNPVENLLKVTLLQFEEEAKDTAKENDTQDQEDKSDKNADKKEHKNENEEKKEDEKKDAGEAQDKTDVEKDTEKEKKKDGSLGVTAVIHKPDRNMNNSCESRCFVSTAEVNLNISLPFEKE